MTTTVRIDDVPQVSLGTQVEGRLQFTHLVELFSESDAPAIRSVDGRAPLSHQQLKAFVRDNSLASFGITSASRVGILLAEGPELGSCLLTVMATCCAVPINYHLTDAEVVAELSTLGATAVVLAKPKDELVQLLGQAGIKIIVLIADVGTCGLFDLSLWDAADSKTPNDPKRNSGFQSKQQKRRSSMFNQGPRSRRASRFDYGVFLDAYEPPSQSQSQTDRKRKESMAVQKTSSRFLSFSYPYSHHNEPDSFAMILRTSGTSGNKKTVPYTLKTLVIGALCVAHTWGLKAGQDINLNMMPLYHVGGIVRNLLAPILSGSTVIITSGFDAEAFWDILQTHSPTWYYAVPTMHMGILDQGQAANKNGNLSANGRGGVGFRTSIRMIANAGGGLPHSLAVRLREMFQGSTVLPSYGMTECMPIASPPMDYKLEKPGTSGVAVGPEIAIKDDTGNTLPPNKFGRITVRGPPVFQGYEGNESATSEAFTADGFFDTGDMGYLDADGYLFITGRSKEVINRGGEIISPVEVEDAVIRHPQIQTAIAFSVPHNVLQETIGVAIVTKEGSSRVGLLELQRFVATILHPSKWPQLIVYMNDLPKNQTGKPLRIKLAERMNIGEINDTMHVMDRSFEAICPPLGTLLSVPIEAHKVPRIDAFALQITLSHIITFAAIFVSRHGDDLVLFIEHALLVEANVRKFFVNRVHDYEVPQHIVIMKSLPRSATGDVDGEKCMALFAASNAENLSPIETSVVSTFEKVLGLKTAPRSTDDFFEIGGGSLTAAKVIASIRGEFGVKLSPMTIFKARTAKDLAAVIEREFGTNQINNSTMKRKERSEYKSQPPKSKSPTSAVALFIQSLSVLLFQPIPIIVYWLLFAHFMTWLSFIDFFDSRTGGRGSFVASATMLFHLFISGAAAGLVTWLTFPFIGIAAKWAIIGRYQPGKYPLWGSYYLRWWLVDQILGYFGAGFFHMSDELYCTYLRMMGAKIGWNVKIDGLSVIREFDLLDVHHYCSISASTVRGFTVDAGQMVLEPIVIQYASVVNQGSTIAPGAVLPPSTVLPPRSSSHEMKDSSQKHRIFGYTGYPTPSLWFRLFVGYPIVGLVQFFGVLPWLLCMYWLVQFPFYSDKDDPSYTSVSKMGQFLLHQAQVYRVGIHILAVATHSVFGPFFKMAATLFIKRFIVGKFKPGQRTNNQWQVTRVWIMKSLLGSGELCGLYSLFGRHYEGISILYRMLGAKIGNRVYWPGTAMPFYEFDLFEVGDDVVFGSRSKLVFTDAVESRRIVFGAGSMIADRCVILPGVIVGKNAMIGTGSLLYKNGHYAAGSTWIGSKAGGAVLWDEGERDVAEQAPTLKPFGRSFYNKDASYSVHSQLSIFLTNTVFTVFSRIAWNLVPLLAVVSAGTYYNTFKTPPASIQLADVTGHFVFVSGAFGAYYAVSILSLAIGIGAKWIIMGTRKPGSYDWDKSDYCQRWQLYITFQGMHGHLLNSIRGSHFLVAYFRALGCTIGERVCLYPTGGDPMMTEPDLITIGSHTVIDKASVVAHINSRGKFDLNELKIGESCVLRTDSRLLSGAEMENGSKLLEHTLIVGGEIVDMGRVMQGWPASEMEMEDKQTRLSRVY
ncbi:hypothetical protein BDR26DRAFT_938321 [Obelidium mucronatum]|nr:hypothetical protein BDR26DRAFT_938321 [Obelidium mucronatum]